MGTKVTGRLGRRVWRGIEPRTWDPADLTQGLDGYDGQRVPITPVPIEANGWNVKW